ncbi:MAG: MGH1-like glycoside hydrolase domain-containing protein, partial [Anaerolineales bacterium]
MLRQTARTPKAKPPRPPLSVEHARLSAHHTRAADWKLWGPYLSDRAWGTVREDYSPGGTAWDYFPHDHARSRAYRWSEDGIGGICDRGQTLCFALALWNERDPILKERLVGLAGPEGNHGEDAKEYWFYLDSTPTHSYMKMLYKYPQAAFPYARLAEENRRRGKHDFEFELLDTGVFDNDRYFDVVLEYAKASADDLLIRITLSNRGLEAAPQSGEREPLRGSPAQAKLAPAPIHVLPHLWFRNTWSWGEFGEGKPTLEQTAPDTLRAISSNLDEYWLYCGSAGADGLSGATNVAPATPPLLFTENETNTERLYSVANRTPYVKDGINNAIVHGQSHFVNPAHTGTKAAAHYRLTLAPGESVTLKLRLTAQQSGQPFDDFDAVFATRLREADEFYATLQPASLSDDERNVQRQAFAGLLWCKQFFHYNVEKWLSGDPAHAAPAARHEGRNSQWPHLDNRDILSMPDKWEYPWYAAWDLAFHCVPLALIDPDFAKRQLILMLREWYMHPNGQIPAYEWAFGDVNPPVHAWAAWRVYKIEKKQAGVGDTDFLEKVFHKLLLNFTWWVNRKDAEGHNVFQGGFLGLDNIGVFDRSAPLPTGGHLEQSDGTSWMAMYALNLMTIALELARTKPAYEDVATKFFEHFMYIAYAMNNIAGEGIELWDPEDEFPYDVLHLGGGRNQRLRVRSMVGLIPLFAVETIEPETLEHLPHFRRRMEWFLEHKPELAALVSRWHEPGRGSRRLVALMRGHRMKRILKRMLDETEFFSDYGVRSLSKVHERAPYVLRLNDTEHRVDYEPAESRSGLFGGNSNWRGPIWFPVNYLLIEALQKFHHYYSDDFKVECPTGSGQFLTLWEVSQELSRRLTRLFLRGEDGRRPVYGGLTKFQSDPHWRDYVLFHEYFHGDNGAGLGASHQT